MPGPQTRARSKSVSQMDKRGKPQLATVRAGRAASATPDASAGKRRQSAKSGSSSKPSNNSSAASTPRSNNSSNKRGGRKTQATLAAARRVRDMKPSEGLGVKTIKDEELLRRICGYVASIKNDRKRLADVRAAFDIDKAQVKTTQQMCEYLYRNYKSVFNDDDMFQTIKLGSKRWFSMGAMGKYFGFWLPQSLKGMVGKAGVASVLGQSFWKQMNDPRNISFMDRLKELANLWGGKFSTLGQRLKESEATLAELAKSPTLGVGTASYAAQKAIVDRLKAQADFLTQYTNFAAVKTNVASGLMNPAELQKAQTAMQTAAANLQPHGLVVSRSLLGDNVTLYVEPSNLQKLLAFLPWAAAGVAALGVTGALGKGHEMSKQYSAQDAIAEEVRKFRLRLLKAEQPMAGDDTLDSSSSSSDGLSSSSSSSSDAEEDDGEDGEEDIADDAFDDDAAFDETGGNDFDDDDNAMPEPSPKKIRVGRGLERQQQPQATAVRTSPRRSARLSSLQEAEEQQKQQQKQNLRQLERVERQMTNVLGKRHARTPSPPRTAIRDRFPSAPMTHPNTIHEARMFWNTFGALPDGREKERLIKRLGMVLTEEGRRKPHPEVTTLLKLAHVVTDDTFEKFSEVFSADTGRRYGISDVIAEAYKLVRKSWEKFSVLPEDDPRRFIA